MDKLMALSLGIAVVGLVALYFTAQAYSAPSYSMADLNENFFGKNVAVVGKVSQVSQSKEGHVFFTLTDQTSSIQVIAFKSSGLSAPAKGSMVKVQGEYTKYQENPEIIAKKIETLSEA